MDTHVIQYKAPFYDELARHPRINAHVYFFSTAGKEEYRDPGLNRELEWDVPLLRDVDFTFLSNFGTGDISSFFGTVNPGILRILRSEDYDAVLINGWMNASMLLGYTAAWMSDTPVMLRTEAELFCEPYHEDWPQWAEIIKHAVLPQLFDRTDAFLAIGALNRQFYYHYRIPREQIFDVPYAINNEHFAENGRLSSEAKRAVRAKHDLPEGDTVLLYVSKMSRRKRPFDILDAFEQLDFDDLSLVMVGDGPLLEELKTYVKQNDSQDIYLTGFVNQESLPEYYGISDVFLFPTIGNWGIVVNEAMAAGLPVVTTDRVGVAFDLVEEGENGYTYEYANPDALAETLEHMIRNDDLEAMGRHSTELIEQWSYEEGVNGVLNALEYIRRK